MAACAQCGHRTTPGARWCNQCGTPVPDVSLGARSPAAYDPPALIDVPASSSDLEFTPAPAPRPDELSTSTPSGSAPTALALGPPPPPPPVRHTRPIPRLPERSRGTGRRRRLAPGILIAGVSALVVVVALIVTVLVTGGDDDPAGDSGDDGATSGEAAADADVEVPSTAPDGKDANGKDVSYGAANLHDGDATTTWRMKGDAAGEDLAVSWPEPVTITDVGLVNGYAKEDESSGAERYGENRRVLAVTWIFDDGTEVTKSLEETTDMQTFRLDAPVETSGVTVRIDETSDPGGRDFTAISELSFLAR